MLKKLLCICVVALTLATTVKAQLNVTFRSSVPTTNGEAGNDIWGWEKDGKEFAIMGRQNGVTIVDVTDPDNPSIRAEIAGDGSTWRDIKTHEDYAYVTTDVGDDGLLVIDMSPLPDSVRYKFWRPDLPGLGVLNTCHNLYIDDGYIYLAGCNVNGGGAVIIDVKTDPWNPQLAGVGSNIYTHDNYARDNILYTSEIYRGVFTAYDVSDKNNVVSVASQQTEFLFTHNTWLSDDGNIIFTTDERANAPVGAYDISDFDNIKELDQFRPVETLGDGVVPHNVHVWDDYLIISYYSDGCIIVDASRPTNLIEVGNFDTYIPSGQGFNGAWGAYPFLPSGTILVSDRSTGLYVLSPDYKRACWLEGTVTDAVSGSEIEGVDVSIAATQPNQSATDADGKYETGLATAGTYDVTYSAPGYKSQTISVELDNGVLTIQDVQLEANALFTGAVIDAETNEKLTDGIIRLVNLNGNGVFEGRANLAGDINIAFDPGNYEIIAGAWGYEYASEETNLGTTANLTYEVNRAYVDDFALDYKWTIDGDATTGIWERGIPNPTFYDNTPASPERDLDDDIGQECYITGNGGGSAFADDIDNGKTELISPNMDLTTMNQPILKYSRWLRIEDINNSNGIDSFNVYITNGSERVLLESLIVSDAQWVEKEYDLAQLITLTNTMNFIVTAEDQGPGQLVEAGIDKFSVIDANPTTSTRDLITEGYAIEAMPNPSNTQFTVTYELMKGEDQAELRVINILGQVVENRTVQGNIGQLSLGSDWPTGTYLVTLNIAGQSTKAIRLVKID